MNAQTVTVQTAAKLAAAGFPQPSPAPGQWWGDESGKIIFVIKTWVSGGRKYFAVLTNVENTDIPVIDFYFDARDFTGLVYLPTVGDMLRELYGDQIGIDENGLFAVSTAVYREEGEDGSDCYSGGIVSARHEHPAEAAALAWLSLNSSPADLDDF